MSKDAAIRPPGPLPHGSGSRSNMSRAWSADQVNRTGSRPASMAATEQARLNTSNRGRMSQQTLYAQSLRVQSRDIISKNSILCGGQCYLTRERSINILLVLCVFWGFRILLPWGLASPESLQEPSGSSGYHERQSFQLGGALRSAARDHYHRTRSHSSSSRVASAISQERRSAHSAVNEDTQAAPGGRSSLHGPSAGAHTALKRQQVGDAVPRAVTSDSSATSSDAEQHEPVPTFIPSSHWRMIEPARNLFNMTSYLENHLPAVAKKPRPFKCVSWRQTGNCNAYGPREPQNDKPCHEKIPTGASGYCELIEEGSNQLRRVMQMNCTSYPNSVLIHGVINCDQAGEFAMFSEESVQYRPPDDLRSREEFDIAEPQSRGIVFCVADSLLVSAYAAIRNLRQLGCLLPIELWYLPDELKGQPAIVKDLIYNFQVDLRPISIDRSLLCHDKGSDKCFNTKIYSIYHTKFQSVLLLDTDNFAMSDPSYLFDLPEFRSTGAIFWPDFWSPGNSIFNLEADSILWELTGVPYKPMFEQESGQVLINRTRHLEALDVLMFYNSPDNILYRYGPVFGDKDLFRLAWMRTEQPFHMVQHPPGWAGQLNKAGLFCGMTMVQHDPAGNILFIHRNGFKLGEQPVSHRQIWDAVVEFEGGVEGASYWAHTWVPKKRQGFMTTPCYGFPSDTPGNRRLSLSEREPFINLEQNIVKYARMAVALHDGHS